MGIGQTPMPNFSETPPAKRHTPHMQDLLEFIKRYSYFLVFIALEAVSLTLLFRFNSYHGSVWFTAANNTVAIIEKAEADVETFIKLRQVNKRLTEENYVLQRQNQLLRSQIEKNLQSSTPIDSNQTEALNGYNHIEAEVVTNTNNPQRNNYIVINKGSIDGIRPEMGVVGNGGVVGIVYLANTRHSLVIPVVNRKSSISCRVRGQRYFGYLGWDGGSRVHAHVDDIPRYAKIKVGEVVETSGYSGIFPPGIFVGRIREIKNAPDGQSFRLEVDLGTDFANLRDVLVITSDYKPELDSLNSQAAANENTTTGN